MNRKLRVVLLILFGAAFAVSAAMLIHQMIQYREGDETYAEAEEMAGLPDLTKIAPDTATPDSGAASASVSVPASSSEEKTSVYVDPYADALRAMDFSALRKVNSEVLGWILIPGTRISYPIVQGKDNQYYLTHTWKKWTSVVGSIFMECINDRDFSDFNTIIYGHRMNNGSMFAGLKYYKKQSYWADHPTVYITDDNGTRKYDIFAAYEVSTQGDTYRLKFSSDQAKQAYIDYCLEQSVIDTGITPDTWDQILTLSTCTGNGHATRWIVQAVLRGTPPRQTEEPAANGQDETAADTSGTLQQTPEPAESEESPEAAASSQASAESSASQQLQAEQQPATGDEDSPAA